MLYVHCPLTTAVSAMFSPSAGGAIAAVGGNTVTIEHSVFENNGISCPQGLESAQQAFGGAVFMALTVTVRGWRALDIL